MDKTLIERVQQEAERYADTIVTPGSHDMDYPFSAVQAIKRQVALGAFHAGAAYAGEGKDKRIAELEEALGRLQVWARVGNIRVIRQILGNVQLPIPEPPAP